MKQVRRRRWWHVAWIAAGVAFLVVEILRHRPVGVVTASVIIVVAGARTLVPGRPRRRRGRGTRLEPVPFRMTRVRVYDNPAWLHYRSALLQVIVMWPIFTVFVVLSAASFTLGWQALTVVPEIVVVDAIFFLLARRNLLVDAQGIRIVSLRTSDIPASDIARLTIGRGQMTFGFFAGQTREVILVVTHTGRRIPLDLTGKFMGRKQPDIERALRRMVQLLSLPGDVTYESAPEVGMRPDFGTSFHVLTRGY